LFYLGTLVFNLLEDLAVDTVMLGDLLSRVGCGCGYVSHTTHHRVRLTIMHALPATLRILHVPILQYTLVCAAIVPAFMISCASVACKHAYLRVFYADGTIRSNNCLVSTPAHSSVFGVQMRNRCPWCCFVGPGAVRPRRRQPRPPLPSLRTPFDPLDPEACC
jgi:hypothetical protein